MLRGEKDNENELLDRGFSKDQLKRLKVKTKHQTIEINGLRFKTSLINYKYPLMHYVCLLLNNYEKGNLPFEGSISEQPAQIIEILTLLSNMKVSLQNASQRKE